jgi:hypothetical protein
MKLIWGETRNGYRILEFWCGKLLGNGHLEDRRMWKHNIKMDLKVIGYESGSG